MLPADLFSFAFIPAWFEQLYELSQLAAPEPWRYVCPEYETQNNETPILERYINQIFRKQAVEYNYARPEDSDRIFYRRNEFSCFHTGLYTSQYKGIYMCFDRNKKRDTLKQWYFRGFVDESSERLRYVQPLPQRPAFPMRQWIYEANGRYMRERGENVFALTNFVVHPLEMLEAENETQMTCDLVTMYGEAFRLSFMTSDFSSAQKFKAVLNRRTISLCYMGSDGDLEVLKSYISGLDWQHKRGYTALGLHERDGRWVYVSRECAKAAGGEDVMDMVQMDKCASIETDVLRHDPITAEGMATLGQNLLDYNEPAKTVTVLAWCAGCFVKEMLRSAGVKYPHLFLIGEAGSGKSTTLERVVLPIFGRSKVIAAPQITGFTLMKDAASSNLFPQALDEFKPSKIEKTRLGALYNHMRDSYDGHEGVRGRADQTQVSYALLAPLVIAGEESPDETAIRERGMELLFSKRDLKDASARAAFARITERHGDLTAMGRALLDTALTLRTDAVVQWHKEALPMFNAALPSRILNNLACCMVGLRLMEAMLARLGLAWGQVFSVGMDACVAYMEYGVREYLLDGGNSNKSVVELTLEVIDRMGLTADEFRTLPDENAAFYFKGFYDRYTQYRRDHAIVGECLPYGQFMKQLRKSDLYVETKTIRFGDDTRFAVVLNYPLLRKRCDVDGFIHSQIEPLVGSVC